MFTEGVLWLIVCGCGVVGFWFDLVGFAVWGGVVEVGFSFFGWFAIVYVG